jgi:hypothetical protein
MRIPRESMRDLVFAPPANTDRCTVTINPDALARLMAESRTDTVEMSREEIATRLAMPVSDGATSPIALLGVRRALVVAALESEGLVPLNFIRAGNAEMFGLRRALVAVPKGDRVQHVLVRHDGAWLPYSIRTGADVALLARDLTR